MNQSCVTLVILLGVACIANSANVLILAGIPSPSHHIWFRSLANGLAKQSGHNVTVLSPDIEKNPIENVHYIHIETIYEQLYGNNDGVEATYNLTEMVMAKQTEFEELAMFTEFAATLCKSKKSPPFQ